MKSEIKIIIAFPICGLALAEAGWLLMNFSGLSKDTTSTTWVDIATLVSSPSYLLVAYSYLYFNKRVIGKASVPAAIFYGLAGWSLILLYSVHYFLLPSIDSYLDRNHAVKACELPEREELKKR